MGYLLSDTYLFEHVCFLTLDEATMKIKSITGLLKIKSNKEKAEAYPRGGCWVVNSQDQRPERT